jgi:hypothetical protein
MAPHNETLSVAGTARRKHLKFTRGCLATCLLALLLSNVVRAAPSSDEPPAGADPPLALSHAIQDHVLHLSRLARAEAGRPWDVTRASTRIHLTRCDSKKKAILLGAAIGAAVGAAAAVYVVRELSDGRPSYDNSASRFIAYMTAGGAGAGALGGLVACR